MVMKVMEGAQLKAGNYILIDGDSYVVRNMEISKTGKHGHAKCRFDAISLTTGNKKVVLVPGHERFEVPLIEKKKAQVLSIMDKRASLMDLETFENFELDIPEEIKDEVKDGATIEYWIMEGKKVMKRGL